MTVIDPTLTWRKVEERLAVEQDPVLRRNLELLLQHMKAEAALDLESLMATVSENAYYEAFGSATEPLVGKAAVRAYYEAFAASGAHRLHFDLDRLVVDRHCIVTEGLMRMAYPGSTLEDHHGISVDDRDAHYLMETRMTVIWPIGDDGLFIGEDSYTATNGFEGIAQRKLDPADIRPYQPA